MKHLLITLLLAGVSHAKSWCDVETKEECIARGCAWENQCTDYYQPAEYMTDGSGGGNYEFSDACKGVTCGENQFCTLGSCECFAMYYAVDDPQIDDYQCYLDPQSTTSQIFFEVYFADVDANTLDPDWVAQEIISKFESLATFVTIDVVSMQPGSLTVNVSATYENTTEIDSEYLENNLPTDFQLTEGGGVTSADRVLTKAYASDGTKTVNFEYVSPITTTASPQPDPVGPAPEEKKNNTALFAGIGAGAGALILIVIAVLCKKKKSRAIYSFHIPVKNWMVV